MAEVVTLLLPLFCWMQDVGLEFVDRPLLEFYPNYSEEISSEEMLTEIYIPVQ